MSYEPDISDSSYRRDPKPTLEQVAKTPEGRVMQQYAEEVRDEVQETTGLGQFIGEGEDLTNKKNKKLEDIITDFCDHIERCPAFQFTDYAQLVYGKKGEQIIELKENLSPKELGRLKAALQGLKLPPAKGGERQKQLEIINRLIHETEGRLAPEKERIEIVKIKQNILDTLSPLGSLYERTRKNVAERKWDEVEKCNIEAVKKTENLHKYMTDLSEKAPDELIGIIGEIAKSGLPVSLYKTAVINFAQTHRLKKISEDTLMSLKNEQKYGKSKFAEAFLSTYINKPKNENPVEFIKAVSRVPEKHFNRMHREALREIREAA